MNTMKLNTMKLAIPLLVALACSPAQGSLLGTTLDDYAVLATGGVTCVAPCTIFGDVGSAPTAAGGAYTFLFGGVDDANAGTAQTELTTAVGLVNAGAADFTIAAGIGNLDAYQLLNGGFAPGTYDVGAGAMNLVGNMTLVGGANLNPVWRFRFSSTLITGASSNVFVTGDNLANAGIYWTTVAAATLDGLTFQGNVMAGSTITSSTGVGMNISCGRLLAQAASVTLNNDTIRTDCVGAGFGSDGFDQAGVIPEPETYAMMLAGLGLMGWVARRRQRKEAVSA